MLCFYNNQFMEIINLGMVWWSLRLTVTTPKVDYFPIKAFWSVSFLWYNSNFPMITLCINIVEHTWKKLVPLTTYIIVAINHHSVYSLSFFSPEYPWFIVRAAVREKWIITFWTIRIQNSSDIHIVIYCWYGATTHRIVFYLLYFTGQLFCLKTFWRCSSTVCWHKALKMNIEWTLY